MKKILFGLTTLGILTFVSFIGVSIVSAKVVAPDNQGSISYSTPKGDLTNVSISFSSEKTVKGNLLYCSNARISVNKTTYKESACSGDPYLKCFATFGSKQHAFYWFCGE